jgi:hypothetical protein
VLAHIGPVQTVAVEFHLAGQREKPFLAIRYNFHDATVQLSAQQINQRSNPSSAGVFDRSLRDSVFCRQNNLQYQEVTLPAM